MSLLLNSNAETVFFDKYGQFANRRSAMKQQVKIYKTIGLTIFNLTVFAFYAIAGSNIILPGSEDGKLTEEIWYDVPGETFDEHIIRNIFERHSDAKNSLIETLAKDVGDNYIRRVRGYITAPETGLYTFWASGDNAVSVWLSSSESKFDKENIIDSRYWGGPKQWDNHPSQKSSPLELEAGKKYYFEVLHKEDSRGSHFSVAWTTPSAKRKVIKSQYLSSYSGQSNDLDDDELLDAWEIENGLNAGVSGAESISEGKYGDSDLDGLTNYEEMLTGSSPVLADTDLDGVTDFEEYYFFHSNLNEQDVGAFNMVATFSGSEITDEFGLWEIEDEIIKQRGRRGSITYSINLSQSGLYALKFNIEAYAGGEYNYLHDFVISLNGNFLQRERIRIVPLGKTSLIVLTPWLESNTNYDVTLYVDNTYPQRKIAVNSLEIQAAGGEDSNGDNTPDWVERKIEARNGFAKEQVYSMTSPAYIEGKVAYPSLMNANGVNPVPLPNDKFYAYLPLNAERPETFVFEFENSALLDQVVVHWFKTNLLNSEDLTIKKGDSLLFTAYKTQETQGSESYSLSISGKQYNQDSSIAVPVKFDEAGDHELTFTHSDEAGTVTNGSIIVKVLELPNVEGPTCISGYPIEWNLENLPNEFSIEVDKSVISDQISERVIALETKSPESKLAAIRLKATGEAVGLININSANIRSSEKTGFYQIGTQDDGKEIWSMPVVLTGDLNEAYVQCNIFIGGVTYDDGTTKKDLTLSDFDEFGRAFLKFVKDPKAHSNCHRFKVIKDNTEIAYFH
ncbi:MAG: PA14 domain-containing protein [Verrucomicrobiota bacterium]